MATAQPDRIVCPGCGRSGPYRPELVGKRLKCKCGGFIEVPAAPAADVESEEPLRVTPIAAAPAENPEDEYDIREPVEAPKKGTARPPDVVAYRTAAPEKPAPEPDPKTF